MPSMVVTNNAPSGLVVWEPVFDSDILAAPGAATYAVGTLLARKTVEDAVVVDSSGNTGDGTTTLATVAAGSVVPLVGAYNLECIEAVTNGGVFKLEDPNGAQVATQLIMTAGAGVATVFEAAGLTFTVTDASTDFIVGDNFSLTVAADGELVAYSRTGAGGAQIAVAVLSVEEVFAGAASQPIRPLLGGRVRRADLIVHGVGAVTQAEVDALRDFTIVASPVTQLAELDNQ